MVPIDLGVRTQYNGVVHIRRQPSEFALVVGFFLTKQPAEKPVPFLFLLVEVDFC
jgi:hypothetical protein